MKRLIKILTVCLCLVLAVVALNACGGDDGTIKGEFTYEGGIYAPLEGGMSKTLVLRGVESGVSALTVPEKVKGYDVAVIEANAFKDNKTLESFTFNSKISERNGSGAEIGSFAFSGCTSLKSVTIKGVVRLGLSAFDGCTALESFVAKDAVKTGGVEASFELFTDAESLKTLDINASLVYNHGSGISIPASVETLTFSGENANQVNVSITSEALKSVTIDVSLGTIHFENCPLLSNVSVNEGATTFPTFKNCSALTEITIPSSINAIYQSLFINCENLSKINISDINSFIALSARNSFNNAIMTINGNAYAPLYLNGAPLTEIVIPDSESSVGCLFRGCETLERVTLSNALTEIPANAFKGCKSLSEITIPDSVTTIGAGAFSDCALTKVVIGKNVSSIGYTAFDNNRNLFEVYNLSSLAINVGSTDFGGVAKYAYVIHTDLSTPSAFDKVGEFIFYTVDGTSYLAGYNGSARAITLPADYNGRGYKIADRAFADTRLLSVTIPAGVSEIGKRAFKNSTIVAVYIESENTPLSVDSFLETEYLTEVYYPSATVLNDTLSSSYGSFSSLHRITSKSESIITVSGDFAFKRVDNINHLFLYASENRTFTLPDGIGGKPYVLDSTAFIPLRPLVSSNGVLTNITIPDNALYEIEQGAFDSIAVNYTVDGKGKYISNWLISYTIENNESVFAPREGTVGIASKVIVSLSNSGITNTVSSIVFPSTVKYLSSNWCKDLSLTDISLFHLPENVVYVATSAIPMGAQITIPATAEIIRSGALYGVSVSGTVTVSGGLFSEGNLNATFENIVIADNTVLPYNLKITAKNITFGNNVTVSRNEYIGYYDRVFNEGVIESASFPSLEAYLTFMGSINSSYDTPLYYGAALLINGEELNGELTLPEGMTVIPRYAFYGVNITRLVIPDSVELIDNYAFDNCESLTEIVFGTGLKEIKCGLPYGITSIDIPSVQYWFDINYEYVLGNPTDFYINGVKLDEVTVPDGVTELKSYCFYNWNVSKVILPDSVTKLASYSLYSEALETIEGGAGVIEVEYGYRMYETEVIPHVYGNIIYNFDGPIAPVSNDIIWAAFKVGTDIPTGFFENCLSLIHVYIPEGCVGGAEMFRVSSESELANRLALRVSFGDDFEGSTSWRNVYGGYRVGAVVNASGVNTTLGIVKTDVFLSPEGIAYTVDERGGANTAEVVGYFGKNTDVTIPEYFGNYFVYSIDTSAFLLHNGIGAVEVIDARQIGDMAFMGSSLTSIDFGNAIRIGSLAFAECPLLTEAYLGAVEEIGLYAFQNCTSLATVSIEYTSDRNLYIRDYAFYGCTALTELTIPDNIYTIGSYAFSESGIKKLYVSQNAIEWSVIDGASTDLPTVVGTYTASDPEGFAQAISGIYAYCYWANNALFLS